MSRDTRRTPAGAALVGALTLAAWLYMAPSSLLKLLPSPHFETIVLSGSDADGTVLDLQGAWFNEGRRTELIISSEPCEDGWSRPENITIRNGRLRGSIRVIGLGRNGEAEGVRESSVHPGHTERAQQAAPRHILIEDLEIVASHRIPLYLAPGTTEVTVQNCVFRGWSVSTAVYLCAESARNTLRDNTFATRVSREVVAVDGSAGNLIAGNTFDHMPLGGIYLYRNCGEGGTVRHQTPRENVIRGNSFRENPRLGNYAIWLGSRGGWGHYCNQDKGHPFGSSIDDRDFADDNLVAGNSFAFPSGRTIRNNGQGNKISF